MSTNIERWPASAPGRSRACAAGPFVWAVANARTVGAPLAQQIEETFALLDATLAETGTSRERIVSVQVVLADIADRGAFDAAWQLWVGDDPRHWPQRAVYAAALAPGLLLELIVTAVR